MLLKRLVCVCVTGLLLIGADHAMAAALVPHLDAESPYSFTVDGSVLIHANGQRFDAYNQPVELVSDGGNVVVNESVTNTSLGLWPTAVARHSVMGELAMTEGSAGASAKVYFDGPGYLAENTSLTQFYANRASIWAWVAAASYYYRPSWRQGFNADSTDDNFNVQASYDLTVHGDGYAQFRIEARAGDKMGDPITLSIGEDSAGWVLHNGVTYNAATQRTITAQIGDLIGIQTSALGISSSWGGKTVDQIPYEHYIMGDSASHGISVTIPLSHGVEPGNGLLPSSRPEPNRLVFTDIFPEGSADGVGVTTPIWLTIDTVTPSYDITITDNSVLALALPGDLPDSPTMNVQYYDGEQWIDAREAQPDGLYGYVAGDMIFFDPSITQFRLLDINWQAGMMPDSFSLGLQFSGIGTQVDILAVPEPATLSLLAAGGLAMLRRRK